MRVSVQFAMMCFLALFISGCVSDTVAVENVAETVQTTDQQNLPNETKLIGVNIYLYSKEHKEPQPMLVNVLSESPDLSTFSLKINESTQITKLETVQEMFIYRLQLEYGDAARIKERKDYLYVTDNAGTGYLKLIDFSDEFNFERFADKEIEEMLNRVGYSDWFIAAQPILKGNTPNETQKKPSIEEEDTISEQKAEDNNTNVFSLSVGDTFIALRDLDDKINFEEILGIPVTQEVEKLKDADTYTGSFIKKLSYDGLKIELFSPKQNGETFWVMSMEVSKEGYRTSAGIEVGSTLEEVKTAYPGIEMALDGRTDPNNGAYRINDEMKFNYLQFEVKDGMVLEIKIFSLLP